MAKISEDQVLITTQHPDTWSGDGPETEDDESWEG